MESNYQEACQIARETGYITVSLLQRRLCLGYTRASVLVTLMEKRGVVAPRTVGSTYQAFIQEAEHDAAE